MKQTVNERIRLLRLHLNLTQQDFAELVGITSTQLSRIENGNATPQNGTIKRITDAIELKYDWLMDGKGEIEAQIKVKSKLAEVNNNPWKDEAYQSLKDEIKDLREKHSKAMEMLSRMIDRLSLGKHNVFGKEAIKYNIESKTTVNKKLN